tara:strand:- start:125 stop:376 length:252 start_codon:yes stop_codon:yes gene_type:complete
MIRISKIIAIIIVTLCLVKVSFSADGSKGGPMNIKEQEAFKILPFHNKAIMLRKWDDDAKRKDLEIISIHEFKKDIMLLLKDN